MCRKGPEKLLGLPVEARANVLGNKLDTRILEARREDVVEGWDEAYFFVKIIVLILYLDFVSEYLWKKSLPFPRSLITASRTVPHAV